MLTADYPTMDHCLKPALKSCSLKARLFSVEK